MVGHTWAADLLRGHLAADQVRHAYLFGGAQGLGRRTLALCLAAALLCESPPSAGEACGSCRGCRAVAAGRHPDVHSLKADEGASIKVEDIRELQRQLALSPHGAARRFALLEDFDSATDSAQNALLKTLEEP
ncbi:MAG TPA: hypothetical protein VH835_06750, partial [Dongiaceae bacterium]